ncbi:DNA-directed RNA polymerase subunit omega [Candidatus Marinimicrobia bacterium PRS2]|jgi:DNA-directed RNA polymerase omega subunit|nr:DNA-directed RNA polymerase subunit omega [Candidatus Marinimicrobia bacterium PRS2]
MNVKAIHMSDLFDKCDDIYTSVMIVAQRAKQIIDNSVIQIDENEDVEDSFQFTEREIIVEDEDKPMVVALEEHLNGELEWRRPDEDDPVSDGS